MTPHRIILFGGAAVFMTLSASPSAAQIVERRSSLPSDATTIEALVKRIESLENQVAQLKQQTAFIKSVNPLVLDASGAAISIRGGSISLDFATGFDVRAGSNASIRAGSTMIVEGAAGLDLKGAVVKLNGGSRPIACVGALTSVPTVSTGGTIDHSHTITIPFGGCGASVLVPQN